MIVGHFRDRAAHHFLNELLSDDESMLQAAVHNLFERWPVFETRAADNVDHVQAIKVRTGDGPITDPLLFFVREESQKFRHLAPPTQDREAPHFDAIAVDRKLKINEATAVTDSVFLFCVVATSGIRK